MSAALQPSIAIPFRKIEQMGGEIVIRGLSKMEFIRLAAEFPEYRMEREPNGDIIIMAPVHGGSGFRENNLTTRVTIWCIQHKAGMVFSPSTGYDLPNGATKSPDVSFVSMKKIQKLRPEQIEESYLPVVPDFVGEVRSSSDKLARLQKKMLDTWIGNGVQLAWLIDPYNEKAYIYRMNGVAEVVSGFDRKLSGEDVLPGFELDLAEFRLISKK